MKPTAENLSRETWALARTSTEIDRLLNSYDPETGEFPEDFDEQLNALALDAGEKMVACIDATKQLASVEDMLKAEASRLRDRAKAMGARASRVKSAVAALLRFVGERKVETPLFTIWIQNHPPSLDIEDESLVPAEYVEIVQTQRIMKKEIIAALKGGATVPGCTLRQGEGLRFK